MYYPPRACGGKHTPCACEHEGTKERREDEKQTNRVILHRNRINLPSTHFLYAFAFDHFLLPSQVLGQNPHKKTIKLKYRHRYILYNKRAILTHFCQFYLQKASCAMPYVSREYHPVRERKGMGLRSEDDFVGVW